MPDDDIQEETATDQAHPDSVRLEFLWKLAYTQGSFNIANGKLYRGPDDFRAAIDKLKAQSDKMVIPVAPKQVQVAAPRTGQVTPGLTSDRFQKPLAKPAAPSDPVVLRPNMPVGTVPEGSIVLPGTKPAPLQPKPGSKPRNAYSPPPISQATSIPTAAAAGREGKYK